MQFGVTWNHCSNDTLLILYASHYTFICFFFPLWIFLGIWEKCVLFHQCVMINWLLGSNAISELLLKQRIKTSLPSNDKRARLVMKSLCLLWIGITSVNCKNLWHNPLRKKWCQYSGAEKANNSRINKSVLCTQDFLVTHSPRKYCIIKGDQVAPPRPPIVTSPGVCSVFSCGF